MADITRAFENLNRSLRYISDNQRLKQQSAMKHEQDMAVLQERVNDPRIKLAKEQAAAQMADTTLKSPIVPTLSTTGTILNESEYKPGVNKMLFEHNYELGDGNKIFHMGTNDEVTGPEYKIKPIQTALRNYMSLADLPINSRARKVSSLQQKIADIENKDEGTRGKNTNIKLKNYERELKDIQTKMADPNNQWKELHSNLNQLKNTRRNVLLTTGNKEFMNQLNTMISQNIKEIDAVGAGGGVENIKLYTYHRKDLNGEWIERRRYLPFGQTPNNLFREDGKDWTLGTAPKSKSGGKGSMSDKEQLRKDRLTSAIRKEKLMRTDLKVLSNQISSDEYLLTWVSDGRGTREEGSINYQKLMATPDSDIKKITDESLLSYQKINYHTPGYWSGRKREKDAFKKRWREYAEKNDLNPSLDRRSNKVSSGTNNTDQEDQVRKLLFH